MTDEIIDNPDEPIIEVEPVKVPGYEILAREIKVARSKKDNHAAQKKLNSAGLTREERIAFVVCILHGNELSIVSKALECSIAEAEELLESVKTKLD